MSFSRRIYLPEVSWLGLPLIESQNLNKYSICEERDCKTQLTDHKAAFLLGGRVIILVCVLTERI
jgi:hypothetical protein